MSDRPFELGSQEEELVKPVDASWGGFTGLSRTHSLYGKIKLQHANVWSGWRVVIGVAIAILLMVLGIYRWAPAEFDALLGSSLGVHATLSPEAVDAFESGLRLLRKDTETSYIQAVGHFNNCVRQDPRLAAAEAFAGLSDVLRADAHRGLAKSMDMGLTVLEEGGRLLHVGVARVEQALHRAPDDVGVRLAFALMQVRESEQSSAAAMELRSIDTNWRSDMPGSELMVPWRELLRAEVLAAGMADDKSIKDAFEAALRAEPELHHARYRYAQWLAQHGYVEQAIMELQHILQREPGHVPARNAVARLKLR